MTPATGTNAVARSQWDRQAGMHTGITCFCVVASRPCLRVLFSYIR